MDFKPYTKTGYEQYEEFEVPKDELYVPLLSGSVQHSDDFGYLRDDSGDNISDLNDYYAEMTGEYWVWKNSDADIVGFCHYRRYFAKGISLKLLEREDIEEMLRFPNATHDDFVDMLSQYLLNYEYRYSGKVDTDNRFSLLAKAIRGY